jgi:Domain of unknown function (DUF4349)
MRLTDEQIGAELHALRETPSERFAAELDRRAAEGFPAAAGEPEVRGWRDRLAPLLRPQLAFAGAATLLLALIVSVAVIGSLEDDVEQPSVQPSGDAAEEPQSLESGRAGDAAAERAPGMSVEPAPTTVPPVPPTEELKPGRERIQERSASMTLSTEPDEVDDVADGVIEVTERFDGIVVSSNVSTSDGTGRASFDLRIPSQNLQAALAELSDLADVASRDEGTLDITAPFVSAEERFDDARAEVDALLDRLSEADSASEVASIREQLRTARADLAAARAELGSLKQRADFSRLSLTVVGDGDGDGWSIGDAAEDSVDVLEALGGAALVVLAVLVPLGAIAGFAWLGVRALRRRNREKVLDET